MNIKGKKEKINKSVHYITYTWSCKYTGTQIF